jgi:perosamine synthetase
VRLGFNFRLDEMSAALGLSQLARIETIVADRARVAGWYLDGLRDVLGVVLPAVQPGVRMSWFVFVVRLSAKFVRADRDRILSELSRQGIGCRDYFQPIHLQPYVRELLGTKAGDFPVTEAVGDRSISLPFYNRLERAEVDRVVLALSSAVGRR